MIHSVTPSDDPGTRRRAGYMTQMNWVNFKFSLGSIEQTAKGANLNMVGICLNFERLMVDKA